MGQGLAQFKLLSETKGMSPPAFLIISPDVWQERNGERWGLQAVLDHPKWSVRVGNCKIYL